MHCIECYGNCIHRMMEVHAKVATNAIDGVKEGFAKEVAFEWTEGCVSVFPVIERNKGIPERQNRLLYVNL